MELTKDSASYRDPSGHVYSSGGKIFRTVTNYAKDNYLYFKDNKTLKRLQDKAWVIAANEINDNLGRYLPNELVDETFCLLEHPKIPYISYPYEWSFQLLKAAASRHLEVQIALLKDDVSLSDATAYNIQFIDGVNPVFIDYLSFQKYADGDFWMGHRQFCEQFLNPLLLRSSLDVAHNSWYRGNLEGIPVSEINKLLPFHKKLSWRVFMNIVLPNKLQNQAKNNKNTGAGKLKKAKLHKAGYLGMLTQLHSWVNSMNPLKAPNTTWSDYAKNNTYSSIEEENKHNFIGEFIRETKPEFVVDIGCNTGEYSETALKNGAKRVVGFDYDQGALDTAYERSKERDLSFLPLYLDAANPSPGQGWREQERKGFSDRVKADAIIALAFEHHLAIARNLSLDDVVDWLTSFAPRGIIEFVQKDDPTIQIMLSVREDIFHDYNEENFCKALEKRAKIIKKLTVSDANRQLYWFEKN